MEEDGIYPPGGNRRWSKVGVAGMLKNPVYLGQARSGKVVKENAHEALVTRAEFDAAQVTRTLLKRRDGSLAWQALLGAMSAAPAVGTRSRARFVRYLPEAALLLGEQKFVEGVEARQGALDEGRRASAEAQLQAALTSEIGDGDLLRAWPSLSVREKRRLMHGLLDRVVVQRADRGGRHARPISDRTQIILRGNLLLNQPAAPVAAH